METSAAGSFGVLVFFKVILGLSEVCAVPFVFYWKGAGRALNFCIRILIGWGKWSLVRGKFADTFADGHVDGRPSGVSSAANTGARTPIVISRIF